MKRLAAHMIQTAGTVLAIWAIGYEVRGPLADPSVPRDLALGGSIVGGVMALRWSMQELSEEKKTS